MLAQSITPHPEPGNLVVNEILYAPSLSSQEFIELFNRSSQTINLCQLTFSDNRNEKVEICSGTFEFPPTSFAILARDSVALIQLPGIIQETIQGIVIEPASWPTLNNSGDAVRLFFGELLVDEVVYDPSWGKAGVSLERIDPAGPSSLAFNWGPASALSGSTPGMQNSIYSPDTIPPSLLLAEVSERQKITLIWNESIDTTSLNRSSFFINDRTPASIQHLSSTITNLLFDFDVEDNWLSYREVKDFSGNQTKEVQQHLAFLPEQGDLLINEIMYAPLANEEDHRPDQPEYVELYNDSSRLLSLRGLTLTGHPNEFQDADTLQSSAQNPTAVPGAYVVYVASSSTSASLATAFPTINFDNETITLLPVDRSSLGLSNTGDVIRVSAGKLSIDDVVYSTDWHHPLLEETRGISLERRSLKTSAFLPSNWGSSVSTEGGTPGIANSVVIEAIPSNTQGNISLGQKTFSPDGDGVDDVLPIHFSLQNSSAVIEIRIYNIDGRLVRHLVESTIVAQQGTYLWDGTDNRGQLLPAGVYIIAVEMLDVDHGDTKVFKKPAVLALPLH